MHSTSIRPLPPRTPDAWQPDDSCAALVARQLTRTMNGQVVLDRIDLAFSAGDTVALLGANGSGKTTLLKCLAGILRPTSGEIEWFGSAPLGRPELRPLVGFVGHESCLYPELTASENLLFSARMHALKRPRERVAEMLVRIGLSRRALQPAGRLSHGLRQRLSLAQALLHDPPIILLDEPFAALDDLGRNWLSEQLAELHEQRRTVVYSTHDREPSRGSANRVLKLRAGRLLDVSGASSGLRMCA